jgi:hypothetical protein
MVLNYTPEGSDPFATGDRRPATGDRRPATGDRRPATEETHFIHDFNCQ